MRIVKKFVTAHAELDGEIRMRIVKKGEPVSDTLE